jgi:CheY-like chemotaxis protein
VNGGKLHCRPPLLPTDQVVAIPPTVSVHLPRHPSQFARDRAWRSVHGIKAPLRILIADDQEDLADLLAQLLLWQGYEVLAVNDGMRALEAARIFRPHLAILDINMPGMHGYSLAEAMRSERPIEEGLVLIAMTAYSQPSDVARAHRAASTNMSRSPRIRQSCVLSWARCLMGERQLAAPLRVWHRSSPRRASDIHQRASQTARTFVGQSGITPIRDGEDSS